MILLNIIQRLIVSFWVPLCVIFVICLFVEPAMADRGVIVYITRKCFIIETTTGYVIVNGWVSPPKGTVVIGDFNTYGPTKIFDTTGTDILGYIYIEEWGLSKSRLQDKWRDKYGDKCE